MLSRLLKRQSRRLVLSFALVAGSALITASAQASTCLPFILLSVTPDTCSASIGNSPFDPSKGFVSLATDRFKTGATSGSFSVPPGFSSLEIFFQTNADQSHPDQFAFTLASASSVGWTLVGNSTKTGARTHSDEIVLAALFGLPDPPATTNPPINGGVPGLQVFASVPPDPVPLPGAALLFGTVVAAGFAAGRWRDRVSRRSLAST